MIMCLKFKVSKLSELHILELRCIIFAFLVLFCKSIYALDTPPPLYDKMFDAINRISQQMEVFNVHYITKLDEKFITIMQTMTAIDTNVKLLQERSQTWDIFAHHMNAWNDNFKSTDQKFEILKKNLDNLPLIENQLQNTDFKVQHIFEKTDMINEKFNEMNKAIVNGNKVGKLKQGARDNANHNNKLHKNASQRNWSQEDFEQTEILLRLSKIQRSIQNSCTAARLDREFESNDEKGFNSAESADIKSMISQINSNLEKFPLKEIKQSFNLNKKHEKALEILSTTVNHIDERTIRIFDTNSYQFKKMLSSYKGTEGEILAFTNNANFLLKKVEKVMKTVVDHNLQAQIHGDEKCNNTISRSSQLSEKTVTTQDDSDEVEDDIIDQKEYIQPTKSNCFQLTSGRNGVYTFGNERQFNDGGRDFYEQYCEYSTEGKAWIVIQKRDNFESQEQFNRSWIHYKHGFGNLSRDFWFGNDFIHNLTCENDMVLRIVLEDFQDNHVWIEYENFKMENEEMRYKLHIDGYRGAVADSLLSCNERKFSTYDNHDNLNSSLSCAMEMGSGWWWSMLNEDCAESNLNGIYRNEPLGILTNSSYDPTRIGIFWKNWLGNSPLKAAKMMIRPKDMWYNNKNNNINNNDDYTQLDDF